MAKLEEQQTSGEKRQIKPIKLGMAGLGIGGGMILKVCGWPTSDGCTNRTLTLLPDIYK